MNVDDDDDESRGLILMKMKL